MQTLFFSSSSLFWQCSCGVKVYISISKDNTFRKLVSTVCASLTCELASISFSLRAMEFHPSITVHVLKLANLGDCIMPFQGFPSLRVGDSKGWNMIQKISLEAWSFPTDTMIPKCFANWFLFFLTTKKVKNFRWAV